MNETSSARDYSITTNRYGQKSEPNIIEQVAAFVRRFVFFRDDVLYDLMSAWIVMTYLKDQFEYVGYLFAHSPEPQSGKSRLLDVLDLLVASSSGILVSPTEAVLFRTASKTTQLLDEVDSWGNKDDLRSVLNAGYNRRGVVVRMREGEGKYEPERYFVYGPKALAGIGTSILSPATRSRAFMFEMFRQTMGERREQWRSRKIEPDANLLKTQIVKWAEVNEGTVREVYDDPDVSFGFLNDFQDRTMDIAQPIAAIMEVAYARNPNLRAARSRLRQAISATRHEERSSGDQHKIIWTLLKLAHSEDPLVGSATELSALGMPFVSDPVSAEAISATLRQYGFKTKSYRRGTEDPKYRYVLPKAKLADILARYCAEDLSIDVLIQPDRPAPEECAAESASATRSSDDSVVDVVTDLEEVEGRIRWQPADREASAAEPTTLTTHIHGRAGNDGDLQ